MRRSSAGQSTASDRVGRLTEVDRWETVVLTLAGSIIGGVLVLAGQNGARRAEDRRHWLTLLRRRSGRQHVHDGRTFVALQRRLLEAGWVAVGPLPRGWSLWQSHEMRVVTWLGAGLWVGSWSVMYLEITRWHHVTSSLVFNYDIGPGARPGLPLILLYVVCAVAPTVVIAGLIRRISARRADRQEPVDLPEATSLLMLRLMRSGCG